VVEYLPRLSDQIGTASEAVHRTLENAPARVDAVAQKLGDVGIVHIIQEQAQNTGTQLKAAATEAGRAVGIQLAQPEPPKKQRGWLVFGVVAAAVAAGVAAWKASKPVEDPWKTPSPVIPKPAPVPVSTVDEAKDTAAGAADKAADATASAAAVGAGATSDAADTVKDKVEDAADKAKHVAEDASETTARIATDAKSSIGNGDKGTSQA